MTLPGATMPPLRWRLPEAIHPAGMGGIARGEDAFQRGLLAALLARSVSGRPDG
jgi:hypothetical protein